MTAILHLKWTGESGVSVPFQTIWLDGQDLVVARSSRSPIAVENVHDGECRNEASILADTGDLIDFADRRYSLKRFCNTVFVQSLHSRPPGFLSNFHVRLAPEGEFADRIVDDHEFENSATSAEPCPVAVFTTLAPHKCRGRYALLGQTDELELIPAWGVGYLALCAIYPHEALC